MPPWCVDFAALHTGCHCFSAIRVVLIAQIKKTCALAAVLLAVLCADESGRIRHERRSSLQAFREVRCGLFYDGQLLDPFGKSQRFCFVPLGISLSALARFCFRCHRRLPSRNILAQQDVLQLRARSKKPARRERPGRFFGMHGAKGQLDQPALQGMMLKKASAQGQQMVTPVWYFLSLMISLILKIPLRPFLLMCIFTSRSSSSRYAPEHMARKLDLEVLT